MHALGVYLTHRARKARLNGEQPPDIRKFFTWALAAGFRWPTSGFVVGHMLMNGDYESLRWACELEGPWRLEVDWGMHDLANMWSYRSGPDDHPDTVRMLAWMIARGFTPHDD